jgi:hypothetical protein
VWSKAFDIVKKSKNDLIYNLYNDHKIEKLNLNLCKSILGVGSKASNLAVVGIGFTVWSKAFNIVWILGIPYLKILFTLKKAFCPLLTRSEIAVEKFPRQPINRPKSKWGLSMNYKKTKIMIFNKGGKLIKCSFSVNDYKLRVCQRI